MDFKTVSGLSEYSEVSETTVYRWILCDNFTQRKEMVSLKYQKLTKIKRFYSANLRLGGISP